MTIEDWRAELFSLYRKCRAHPSWPKNFNEALDWMDVDAREYLIEIDNLHKAGAMLLKSGSKTN